MVSPVNCFNIAKYSYVDRVGSGRSQWTFCIHRRQHLSYSLGILLQPVEETLGEQLLSHYWILICWADKRAVLVEICNISLLYYLGRDEVQLSCSLGYGWTEPTCSDTAGCICMACLITSVPRSFDGWGWCHLTCLMEELCWLSLWKEVKQRRSKLSASTLLWRKAGVSGRSLWSNTKKCIEAFPQS